MVEGSYDPKRNAIKGPRNLNPYGGNVYWTIIQAFLDSLSAGVERVLGKLSADHNRVVSWGREVSTAWFTVPELARMLRQVNPAAMSQLGDRGDHDRLHQLDHDVSVLQRTGGSPASQFAMPLIQSLMCIDSRWLRIGRRTVKQYRLTVGRSEPQRGRKADAQPFAAA